tara:strand:- start:1523 stop:1672 length:150 start_codon:yes stop_codon:yes gene_type:complete
MVKLVSGAKDLATLYPEIAKEWHPTKNGDKTSMGYHTIRRIILEAEAVA